MFKEEIKTLSLHYIKNQLHGQPSTECAKILWPAYEQMEEYLSVLK